MNYSEENEKAHSGFKDIYVDGSSDAKPQDPPITFQSNPIMFQPGPLPSSPNISRLEVIEMHSRIVKWTSLVLSIFSFLYLLPGAIPLVVTFVFPILGFIAAHKYNDCLVKFYTIYLILINIVQIIVMAVIGGVAYIVFQCFVMLAEDIILVYNIKLTKEISGLTLSERNILNGVQSRNIS
ncbi:hypothetical protein SteCoe_16557 [Stentor coeruleus]|uniref:Uncharacterized protein n=1 Tax=Stentor coeruleus TaxID=5963 RepID=A0A1R2C110_9CILI|nr:hypothetical protein SteCoe_16557 [Stentor coeruleus]